MDPSEIATEAGLSHIDPDHLPIERRPRGTGFTYVLGDDTIQETGRRRIEALAIPPAWHDVRIAASDCAHIQAVGIDDAGRTQYRYHPRFREAADRLKFARLGELGERLRRLRSNVAGAIEEATDERDAAAVIGLIDLTAIRVGSMRYVEERGTYGASTLLRRHVDVDDPLVTLGFVAKGGVEREVSFEGRPLARFLDRRLSERHDDDFIFTGPAGGRVTGGAVSRALTDWSGMSMTAKELRTWGATATMVDALMEPAAFPTSATTTGDPVLAAYDVVAEHLGNSRAVARSSYVAPAVVAAFEDGICKRHGRDLVESTVFTRSEQALRKILVA